MPDDSPPCPDCDTDLLVEQFAGGAEWLCYGCSRTFDTPRAHEARRGRPGGERV
jgi:hypothetical protein